jgi:hypothetical protein
MMASPVSVVPLPSLFLEWQLFQNGQTQNVPLFSNPEQNSNYYPASAYPGPEGLLVLNL